MAPIVFLHGWGLTPQVWAPLQARLGVSGDTPQLLAAEGSLDDWAARLLTQLPEGAILVGWSLGAMLAMAIAARAPQHISRLVLIAGTPSFVKRGDWPHGLDAATTKAFRDNFLKDPARTMERFVALQALGDSERSTVATSLRDHLADPQLHAASLAHGLRLLDQSDLRTNLPPVSMRCLLIHGEQDALMPLGAQAWLAQRWSASESFIVAGAGHAPFLSQGAVVAERIAQFIHAG